MHTMAIKLAARLARCFRLMQNQTSRLAHKTSRSKRNEDDEEEEAEIHCIKFAIALDPFAHFAFGEKKRWHLTYSRSNKVHTK